MKSLRLKRCKVIFGGFLATSVWLSCPMQSFASVASMGIESTAPIHVKGCVVDQSGEPLIGVSVQVKGTSTGAITDLDGNFVLTCSSKDVLVISYVGYQTLEIPASKDLSKVVLKENSELLDEVIVIGYGTTTRKSAVGSVDQVRSDVLEDRPVANVTQALQGAAPNVIVQRRSYNPNDEQTNFNIRGISTTTDNSPLFVIDGLLTDQGGFNKLNPNDIENISILKDAGTAAIYGSRSANGVVVVTTKQGKKNSKASVRFSGVVGWNTPNYIFEAVKGYQNATLRNLADTNVGNAPTYSMDYIRDLAEHQDEEAWGYKQIYETAAQQNYNVSVSGGSDKITYMFSAGYFDQKNNYVTKLDYGVQRYNFRTNITAELGRFKVTAIAAYTRSNSLSPTVDNGSTAVDASRVPAAYHYKMQSEDGRYLLNDVLGEFNSLGELNKGSYVKSRDNALTASVNAELKIIDGLKLRGVFGADILGRNRFTRNKPQKYYTSVDATEPRPSKKTDYSVASWNHDSYRLNSQLMLDYLNTFGKHTVNGLIGVTNESYTGTSNEIWKNCVDPDLGISTDKTTGEVGHIGGHTILDDTNRTSITSLLGRFGYNWNERYYAEFSFRYDGSSKFHKNCRWGFFPSISLGWRLSEENFMNAYRENVGDLKIRGSYGVLGNQAVGNYDRFTTYNIDPSGYAFDNKLVSGSRFSLGMDDLTWERTKTFNIGLDASFFKNTLNVSFDYFNKHTVDILMKPIVPSAFGADMPRDNIGEMQNRGWELSINYRLKTGDVNHHFNFNIGDSKNKLLKFPGKEAITQAEEIWKICREGEALYSYYGYKVAGIFQSNEEIANSALPVGADVQPGDLKFVDQDGNGVIDGKDRVVLGNALPRYTFGFSYGFDWKGLDFSMLWQGVGKRAMMLRGELMEPYHSNYSYTMYKHQLDFWTPTNTDAKYPRLAAQGSSSDTNNWSTGSDIFIRDAKYLRLKNVAIGYTLPQNFTRKFGVQKFRVYVNAQDPLTFSNNSFIDPESSEMGSNLGTGAYSGRNYVPLRYYGFGFDIEF